MTSQDLGVSFGNLNSLAAGDQGFVWEILKSLRDQAPQVASEIQTAWEAKDFEAVGSTAHKFKSAVHILGNSKVLDATRELEHQAEQNPQDIERLVFQFGEMCSQLVQVLDKELSRLSSAQA
ncbi:Hpt domain-containing protein [Pontibacter sp. G13]|uniref:Hpt domain-containing protein n=1 Tax=Pontibacter sp. G13 TaxID=3074898 RepID=UPI00288992DF|nr:Hpt domain-containing protein [Pontibacter sp. G13]WNJ21231.1 Hpt domain-containing protein [Pontibacter sp. G13]